MLLVVFGAGASFDSVPHLPPSTIYPAVRTGVARDDVENDRPPLANQLFDTRHQFVEAMNVYRECLEVIPLLRKPDVVVEKELATIRQQAENFPRGHQELAAVLFYLHTAIRECQSAWWKRHLGITNYATFLRELERWRLEVNETICLVTFNYDTMLEDTINQVLGFGFDDFYKYVSWSDYQLVKLHGSIHWAREIKGASRDSPHAVINDAATLEISDQFRFITRPPVLITDNRTGYPALSIPVEKKDEFSCPKSHVEALRAFLPRVTKIITVGWRAMEQDFLNMLRVGLSGPQELLIVSGDERGANETLANLKQDSAVEAYGETVVPVYGFTGLINNIVWLQNFLRRSRS